MDAQKAGKRKNLQVVTYKTLLDEGILNLKLILSKPTKKESTYVFLGIFVYKKFSHYGHKL